MTNVILRFEYQSRNLREDLSPTIIITNDSGAVVVSSTSMVHKSSGIYIYDYTATQRGYYIARMTDTTENRTLSDMQFANVVSGTSSSVTTVSGKYVSTLDLNKFMSMEGIIPALVSGISPEKESLGSVNSSGKTFFTNQRYLIDDSVVIYYGTTEPNATNQLTETTHYTVNLDTGKIILTSAGEVLTGIDGTNSLYTEYSYNTLGFRDSYLRSVLDRAQTQFDKFTNTHFAVGTDTTPDWGVISNEKMDGRGIIDRNGYYLLKYPIPNISTTLTSDVTADDTTINVSSTDGFPSAGNISIGSDKISYTGKTATTFTGCTSVSAHSSGDYVYPIVIEISTTLSGSTPVFETLQIDKEVDIDYANGRISLQDRFLDTATSVIGYSHFPPRNVANRARVSYLYGYDNIPEDVQRCVLMMSAQDLLHQAVRKAHVSGMNNFSPDLIDVDSQEIEGIRMRYTSYRFTPV